MITLNSSLSGTEPSKLGPAVETIFQQLEDQLNRNPGLVVLTDDEPELPEGIRRKDIIFNLQAGVLSIGVYNGKEVVYLL